MRSMLDFATLGLRDAYDFAIMIEEDALLRYGQLADLLGDDPGGAGAVCRSMVVTERQHRHGLMARRASLFQDAPRFEISILEEGIERPDIPVMAVLSTPFSHVLGEFGIDFERFPHFVGTPPVPQPANIYALTKILLVPSVFAEPFGRVAAEALINGIPPLVGNRGALPETIGGAGRVLPIPDWMTESGRELPSSEEVAPWLDAILDKIEAIDDTSALQPHFAALKVGERLYGEEAVRRQYLDYFQALRPGGRPLESA